VFVFLLKQTLAFAQYKRAQIIEVGDALFLPAISKAVP
jgi:hypothetical protein